MMMINDKRVKQLIKNKGELIGSGSYGSVYEMDEDTILKISSPCLSRRRSSDQNCEDIRNEPWIEEFENDQGEKKRYIPNSFIENYIGYNYTNDLPGFTKIKEYYIYDDKAYAVQEKINPSIEDVLTTFEDLAKYLFSLVYFICYAQEKIKFTHYDFHMGNIGYVECDKVISFHLPEYVDVKGNRFSSREVKIHLDYEPRILDLGYSRCEVDNVEIRAKNLSQIPGYSEYNQFYDIAMLFGSLYYECNKNSIPLIDTIGKRNFDLLIRKVWGYDFRDNITLKQIYNKHYFNNMRPENPDCIGRCDPYCILYILSSWIRLCKGKPDEQYSLKKFNIRRQLYIKELEGTNFISIDKFKSHCCGMPLVNQRKSKLVIGYGISNQMGYPDYSNISPKLYKRYFKKLVIDRHSIRLDDTLDENITGPLFIHDNKYILRSKFETNMVTYLVCMDTKEGEKYFVGYSDDSLSDISKELLSYSNKIKYAICLYNDVNSPSIAYNRASYGLDNREAKPYAYLLVASLI